MLDKSIPVDTGHVNGGNAVEQYGLNIVSSVMEVI